MKTRCLQFLVLLVSTGFWACNDQCKETRVTRTFVPVTRSLKELRTGVKAESARALQRPGKMYVKGSYLFINEIKEGIHVIDNSNPASPQFISFINIPGNGDISVRDNILYADSYSDLVSIDISDPAQPKELNRINDVFQWGQFDGASWNLNASIGAIQDNDVTYVTEVVNTNCEQTISPTNWWRAGVASFADMASFSGLGVKSSSPGGTSGQAGSMSRFALYSNFLYAVTQNSLHLFDVTTPSKPTDYLSINFGWGIETIFPYQDKLFIGSNTGMFIFDNSNPSDPKQLSSFQHGRACDPVVVHENIAYVTIRSGNACAGSQNQLDLVDVSNPTAPQLIKSYQMENPHGLSIDFPTLYLCEGSAGLKVFDASDKYEIADHQLAHFKNMDAFDVISMGKNLLVIGKDGFYQYDASDPKNIRFLSKLAVKASNVE